MNLEFFEISNFEAITGKGVKASLINEDKIILVGSNKLMSQYEIDIKSIDVITVLNRHFT
ncbi:MAG: hypothetical protein EU533_04740 [Promethearchaeota archaeon]|nr:MAG: hypothetical protein EU533_04740 [Candidatus Lokiarchaeota archaeon]